MSLLTPPLRRNVPFRSVNLPKGNPFLSLRAIPFLIVLAGCLALQPAGAAPVVATIPVSGPDGVVGIVASPTESLVFVADTLNDRIAAIDTAANQIDFFLFTVHPPEGLGISPDGNTLYVTETPDFLEAISLTTFSDIFLVTVGGGPFIPGVASNASTVYVPNSLDGTVTPVGGPLSGSTITVGGAPLQVVFNKKNTAAYVTNETKKITVINTSTGSKFKISTATETIGLAITGNTLFATGLNRVYVIDTLSNTVTTSFKPAPTPVLFGFPGLTPDGAFLYVPVLETSTAAGNNVLVVRTSTLKVAQNLTVGEEPFQVAAAANDIYGYCTNFIDGTVSAFQLAHVPPGSP